MRILPLSLALLAATALSPVAASAQGVSVTLGFGASYAPDYPGSDEYSVGPTGTFRLHSAQIGPLSFGDPNSRAEKLGFGLRGAFNYIGARKASDHPELAGLNDVDTAIELGLGLGYEAPAWRVFADVRHGVTGHHGTVGVVGGDVKVHPTDRLLLTLGPRATFASEGYVDTYYGVSATEAVASGLPAYNPGAGLVSTGVEFGMVYDLGNDWGVEGKLGYEKLRGDAADSPITGLGSDSQGKASLIFTKRFTIGY